MDMKWWQIALLVLLLPLVVVFVAVAVPLFLLWSSCVHVAIWTWWCPRGKDILLVYSDSPTWREYFERIVLPALGDRTIVLNWSERRQWPVSLARVAFHHFSGEREFNPLAVVFKPLRPTQTFRFWMPFRDFKHGRPQAFHAIEQEFFTAAGILDRLPGDDRPIPVEARNRRQ